VPAFGIKVAPGEAADPEREALAALDRADWDGALAVLMRVYGTPLYRYCREMVVDSDLADDVHQMTFVQAHQSLPRFAGRSSLRTWLFGIARHRCLDALKMDRRRRGRFRRMEEAPDRPNPGKSVEERLADRSLALALEICLGKLAPRIREAVLLRFQQGLSYPEIARISGEEPATLQARVARALPVLRRCIEEQGVSL
jgi:RNA polymerase sigma factor (sigma-70 family)